MNLISNVLWGYAMIVFFLISGIFFTFKIRLKNFDALKISSYKKASKLDIEAITNNLSASLGTGNIVGVGFAIVRGGAGSIFWMWITAIIGSSINYLEGYFGIRFQKNNEGGAMHYLKEIPYKKLSVILPIFFSFFGVLASFTTGNMIQANVVVKTFSSNSTGIFIGSVILALVTFLVTIKGSKKIGEFTIKLVPFMSVIFFFTCFFLLFLNKERIIPSLILIFEDAFSYDALFGGVLGGAIQEGIRKGIFSNEAGMGSSGITHGSANVCEHEAGKSASLCVYLDTIFATTITSLVILTSNTVNYDNPILMAFLSLHSFGAISYSISMIFFGFATIIGWYYIGERCFSSLFSKKCIKTYQVLYVIFAFLGGIMRIDILWDLSDISNAFMMIPNLIGLWILSFKTKFRGE